MRDVGAKGLIFPESVAPNPPAGSRVLYFKNDGKVYAKDSAGTESLIGPSAGGAASGTQTFTAPDATSPASIDKAAPAHTGDVWRLVDSGNVIQATFDGTGVLRLGGRRVAPLTSRLTTQANSTSTSYASTGLVLNVSAGAVYRIHVAGSYQTAATTTGIGFQFAGSCTVTSLRALLMIWGVTATTATQQVQTALSPNAAKSTAVAAANTAYPFIIEGLVRVNAAGTFDLQFASEVNSSQASVHVDSCLMLQEVA